MELKIKYLFFLFDRIDSIISNGVDQEDYKISNDIDLKTYREFNFEIFDQRKNK